MSQEATQTEPLCRRYDYESEDVIACDFGGDVSVSKVEPIGDKTIVVFSQNGEQFQTEIPTGELGEPAGWSVQNGVLTLKFPK